MPDEKLEILEKVLGELTRLADLLTSDAVPGNGELFREDTLETRVVGYWNKHADMRCRPETYKKAIGKLTKNGYTESDIKLVIWWATHVESWPDGFSLTPQTIFKLQSPHGSRCFPQYLDQARHAYVKKYGSLPRGIK